MAALEVGNHAGDGRTSVVGGRAGKQARKKGRLNGNSSATRRHRRGRGAHMIVLHY